MAAESVGDFEYLFFVGSPGSYDDHGKKVSEAFVKILKAAGVKFAILGAEELTSGDAVRRLGNEYLYQMIAQQNIETMNGYGVKKIVTNCPHVFNTLKNEYPDLGGDYEGHPRDATGCRSRSGGSYQPDRDGG